MSRSAGAVSQPCGSEPLVDVPAGSKLHIGATQGAAGWTTFDAQAHNAIDLVGDIRDLSRFRDGEFTAVYASHVLEHVSYHDLLDVVRQVHRILAPSGRFLVSVPDLDVLCALFVCSELTAAARFIVMRIMFGGQVDAYDFHSVGLNEEILSDFLRRGGFSQVVRVTEFGIFRDSSSQRFGGVPISLNLVATKS